MPIVNTEKWQHVLFFSERDFLEIGLRNDGAKIIQIGIEGDALIVAFAFTDDLSKENLNPVELWSLIKFSYTADEYQFHDQPKKINRNSKIIQKYKIITDNQFSLDLDIESDILSIQFQKDILCMWVLESNSEFKIRKKRNFSWIKTGEVIQYQDFKYLFTLQSKMNNHVTHLFEIFDTDFSELEKLLASKKWEKADKETFAILLKLCSSKNSQDGYWVNEENIKNIQLSDLNHINYLWYKYSNGRFGYSIQKCIWQDITDNCEIDINNIQYEKWQNFCEHLGWNTGFPALNFTDSAIEGHLPAIVGWGMPFGPIGFPKTFLSILSCF